MVEVVRIVALICATSGGLLFCLNYYGGAQRITLAVDAALMLAGFVVMLAIP